jgi:hypothetical protein
LIDPNDVLIQSLESQNINCLYTQSMAASAGIANVASNTASTNTRVTTNLRRLDTYKAELKKLNHSILIAYLDLLEILVKAPNTEILVEAGTEFEPPVVKTLREQKLEDIELLFINMHHLINELRPHQARDNIKCILELQKQQRIETAQKFKEHLFKIVELLQICIKSIETNNNNKNLKQLNFIDDLTSLMSNTQKLTKNLTQIQSGAASNNKKNIQSDTITVNGNQTYHSNEDNDIEMNCEEDSIEKEERDEDDEDESPNQIKKQLFRNDCDLKEIVLCDLVDNFVIENSAT